MEFLKKHYEKIVLCVVLLGLAGAAVWMRMAIERVPATLPPPPAGGASERRGGRGPRGPGGTPTITPIDMSTNEAALALATHPLTISLAGDHNLFNPVTWKRKSDGTLLKIVKLGPDALVVTNITKLYTIIAYDHASGNGTGVYVMATQQHWDPKNSKHPINEYAKKNEKVKSGLYDNPRCQR